MSVVKNFSRNRALCLALCMAALLVFCPLTMASGHGEEAAHAEAEDHGEVADHAEHTGWKTWKATDSYKVFNFAVLAIGLFLLVRKPAADALKGRITDIQKELDDLEARRDAAASQLSQVSQRVEHLEQEAKKVVDTYIAQGEAARENILAEAKKAADRLSEQARHHMKYEIEDAKKQLRAEILEKAIAMGEELVAKSITGQDQDRLVGEYLEKVVT